MKLTNTTDDLRTTWGGTEIPAGESCDVDVGEDELAWLERRGVTRGTKPKVTKKKTSRRSYTSDDEITLG